MWWKTFRVYFDISNSLDLVYDTRFFSLFLPSGALNSCKIYRNIHIFAGASCNVFKVSKMLTEKGSNQIVALKQIPRNEKSNAECFAREYKVLRKLIHPNIVVCFCAICLAMNC